MEDTLLKIADLSAAYDSECVLNNINFSLRRGEILAVAGESGSGKSTLLSIIMGLAGKNLQIKSGDIYYKKRPLLNFKSDEWQKLRGREIALLQQDAAAAFCPVRKVGDQLYETIKYHTGWTRNEMNNQAYSVMKKINLQNEVLDEYPFRLSGGMAQRVGILGAALLKPGLLLADEPTAALDTVTQVQVIKELAKLRDDYGMSIIIVTHNIGVAAFLADRAAIIKDGVIVEQGDCQTLLKSPQHEYSKALLAAVPRIQGE